MAPVRVNKTPHDTKPKFDLVIFDCDGVLVDSELISCRAHAQTLTRHGYAITEDQVLERFLGVSDREARLIIEAELGRELPDDFESQVKQATLAFLCRRSARDRPCRRGDRRDRSAEMRGIERHARENPAWA